MDRECQRRVYLLYYSYALSVCLRYARHREEALEVVNDGFLKVYRDVVRFDPARQEINTSFRAWLRKIMVHTAIDHYRAQLRHQTQELPEHAYEHADGSAGALDTLAYEELVALIQRLSPAYRTVFNLYVLDGFTHEEIAGQLGISVGASKSNLSKARGHLKEMLKKINHHAYAESVR
ncbi:RNA polymerase sigma factor [Hymenobacter sp. BT594]|uniref:RNA polymerase sigma factor n=2 Tax=Hymenobacter guriensis TaxID=2793065 RepID=A0ABS0KY84_9BACT|nr:RNA polymerase sigma factor [Hymenobacter guriensis]MBG8552811.1 RNA polymerase sigma factor [Hymenobacter guriensis]